MPEEEGIYFESKPVFADGIDTLHSYLVYRDGKGNARVIRGGTDGSVIFDGNVEVQNDIDLKVSDDSYKAGETMESRYGVKLDLEGRPPIEVWEKMKKKAGEIHEKKFNYDAFPDQNSNSVTRALLDEAGIPFEDVLSEGFEADDYPGIENDLSGAEKRSDVSPFERPVESWSEEDVKTVMNSDAYNTPGHPQREKIQAQVRQWFEGEFGAGPQAVDATSRPLPTSELPRRSRGGGSQGASGPVHVRSHSREGGQVSVDAHDRSRPS